MSNMKAYTDIEQSKKLAEILPLESADMHYSTWTILDGEFIVSPNQGSTIEDLQEDYGNQIIPCWSLVALLDNIPQVKLDNIKQYDKKYWRCYAYFASDWHTSDWCDNPVDACVEMILKLHELNLL